MPIYMQNAEIRSSKASGRQATCGERSPDHQWVCTRPNRHGGWHIAHGDGDLLGIWEAAPKKEATNIADLVRRSNPLKEILLQLVESDLLFEGDQCRSCLNKRVKGKIKHEEDCVISLALQVQEMVKVSKQGSEEEF